MKKFISFKKKSKKKQKEINNMKRRDWGEIKPYGAIIPNKKVYNRKRDKRIP